MENCPRCAEAYWRFKGIPWYGEDDTDSQDTIIEIHEPNEGVNEPTSDASPEPDDIGNLEEEAVESLVPEKATLMPERNMDQGTSGH